MRLATKHILAWMGLVTVSLLFGQACEPAFQIPNLESLESQVAQGESFLTEEEKQACFGSEPRQVSEFKNLSDLVAYLNTFPRPLELHCVIAGLPRPLRLTAGESSGSAQPSPDARNPRIILQVGSLLLGIVPDGVAKGTLEVGAIKSTNMATRAEFLFPISDAPVRESAGLDHIRLGRGTSCGLCHAGETVETTEAIMGSFRSTIIRFNVVQISSVSKIRGEAELCVGQTTDRCLLLRSLFDGGTPQDVQY